ncbi:MAG: tyrosine-type recombinase/integrase [Tissierellia bacterium]|nr:tyrosine-type recombinase/integrase [Tissierellia bacterium]
MKLPNGYGSVCKIKGNRRKPWRVRATVGWDIDGKQIQKTIGCYETRAKAMQALSAYNRDPSSVDKITFLEIYNLWSKDKYPSLSNSSITSYKRSFKYCSRIHHIPIKDIRLADLQMLVDNSNKNKRTLELLKTLISQVFDYAVKYEYVMPDRHKMVSYVDLSNVPEGEKITRKVFTSTEIEKLLVQKAYIPLILICTGMRIGEYLELTENDIYEDHVKIRKAKTKAGIRDIPLISQIRPYFQLSPYKKYDGFRKQYWNPLMSTLGMDHTIHDTRHTFTSICTENRMDPRILKSILGHKYTDVTGVYTHISLDTKLQAMHSIYESCGLCVSYVEELSLSDTCNNQLFQS